MGDLGKSRAGLPSGAREHTGGCQPQQDEKPTNGLRPIRAEIATLRVGSPRTSCARRRLRNRFDGIPASDKLAASCGEAPGAGAQPAAEVLVNRREFFHRGPLGWVRRQRICAATPRRRSTDPARRRHWAMTEEVRHPILPNPVRLFSHSIFTAGRRTPRVPRRKPGSRGSPSWHWPFGRQQPLRRVPAERAILHWTGRPPDFKRGTVPNRARGRRRRGARSARPRRSHGLPRTLALEPLSDGVAVAPCVLSSGQTSWQGPACGLMVGCEALQRRSRGCGDVGGRSDTTGSRPRLGAWPPCCPERHATGPSRHEAARA